MSIARKDKVKTKTILKPRGVRLSDEQWDRLKKRAEEESKKSGNAKVSASDVVRYAVDEMERREASEALCADTDNKT